jgi:hypothetical protein
MRYVASACPLTVGFSRDGLIMAPAVVGCKPG